MLPIQYMRSICISSLQCGLEREGEKGGENNFQGSSIVYWREKIENGGEEGAEEGLT